MKEFIEVPANKNSLAQRKLILGVGVNDAPYKIKIGNNQCPFYTKGLNMLKRCYCQLYQGCFPTYKECTVTPRWLLFSNFKTWMVKQDWEGKELDKDILVPGNKVYSPDNCIFVLSYVNMLLEDHRTAYSIFKHREICRIARLQTDTRVRDGLLLHAELRISEPCR